MQDVEWFLKRLALAQAPPDMETRIICSCRSRLLEMSYAHRRRAAQWAALCTVANLVLGTIALKAHRRHARLKDNLF